MNNADLFRKSLEHFGGLPDEEWDHFSGMISQRHYKRGEKFIEIGGKAEEFGVVVKGLFRVYYLTPKGSVFTRNFLSECSLIGPSSPRAASAPSLIEIEALEDSELLIIPYRQIAGLFKRHTCWLEIGRNIAEEISSIREQREYELLSCDSTARYESFLKIFGHLTNRLTQVQIASYLGISPVSLSRLRAEKARRRKP